MPPLEDHKPWSEGCTKRKRHHHPYTLGPVGFRQCHCGHRHWSIALGGGLPLLVTCARCGRENRTATAYERGRDDGPRKVNHEAEPAF